jgi:hypothetical protein
LEEGWIKLFRKSINSQVFQSEGLWKVWTWCLLKANHEDRWIPVKTGRGTTEVFVKRGQFIFGRKTAAKVLKMKGSTIQDRMQKLVNMQNLVTQPVTHFSLVTVSNYELYQGSEIDEPSLSPSPIRHPSVTNKNDKKKRIYVADSEHLQLASFLLDEIQKNKPDFKKPNLQTWAREFDLLLRRDGRTVDRIQKVIVWVQSDSFWWKNILSARKLREKFDDLEAKMPSTTGGQTW